MESTPSLVFPFWDQQTLMTNCLRFGDFGAFLGPSVRAPGLLPGVSEASGVAAGVTNALGLISQPPVSPPWLPETATPPPLGPG